ncbi:MAG: LPD38 domain-containing protein, partial [Betaproteobacteria bacterium]
MRVAPTITLTEGERVELTKLVRSRRTSVRLAQRARTVARATGQAVRDPLGTDATSGTTASVGAGSPNNPTNPATSSNPSSSNNPTSSNNPDWAALWMQLQAAGGTTGYRDLFAHAQERSDSLAAELARLDRGQANRAAHAVLDWLSDYNETMENAVRLSAFKVARARGISPERAASLAKNLTVNFNRKGRQSREIGALYAFFNASIQGTARMAQTLTGPLGRKILLGGVSLGAVNALIGMAAMGGGGEGGGQGEDAADDNWAKIPEFVKEKNLIVPLSATDYLALPMPLGFHVLPNLGRLAVEMMRAGRDHTPGRQLAKLLQVTLDAFNPMGGSQSLSQLVTPTVADPAVALAQNLDWTGRPIYRENTNPLDPQPGSALTKDAATPWSKAIAEALNRISGGTRYQPGALSPTPDQLDYLIGQLTGGVGREIGKLAQTASAPFTGEELPAHKIPLIGRLYGSTRGV